MKFFIFEIVLHAPSAPITRERIADFPVKIFQYLRMFFPTMPLKPIPLAGYCPSRHFLPTAVTELHK